MVSEEHAPEFIWIFASLFLNSCFMEKRLGIMPVKNFRNNILEGLDFDLREKWIKLHENTMKIFQRYFHYRISWTLSQRNYEARFIFWCRLQTVTSGERWGNTLQTLLHLNSFTCPLTKKEIYRRNCAVTFPLQ